MDSGIRITTYKTGDRRLLDEVFESKPIKREVNSSSINLRNYSTLKNTHNFYEMASQTIINNNFTMVPTSSNPYISRKLNNMD